MYPAYMAVAQLHRQGREPSAASPFRHRGREDPRIDMYRAALEAVVKAGKDITDAPVWVCETCGYTVEGEAPEKCPVCGAVRTKFKQF